MHKLFNEKIQSLLAIINIIFIIGAICVHFNDEHTSNAVQNEQIKALNERFEDFTKMFVERLDRLESKVDTLSDIKSLKN